MAQLNMQKAIWCQGCGAPLVMLQDSMPTNVDVADIGLGM